MLVVYVLVLMLHCYYLLLRNLKGSGMTLTMLIKDISIKTLVTGDKSAWVKLETLRPEDVELLKELLSLQEVKVSFIL